MPSGEWRGMDGITSVADFEFRVGRERKESGIKIQESGVRTQVSGLRLFTGTGTDTIFTFAA
jgi:hypothetical protein